MSPPASSENDLSWDEFERVDLRAGTITQAAPFPEAHTPAYKLWIDFGQEIGTLELWCVARESDRRWKLEFNVRESS